MGQSLGKRSDNEESMKIKSYDSRHTSRGNSEETEVCGTVGKNTSKNTKNGAFARIRNFLRVKSVVTKKTEYGSSEESMESIEIRQDLNDSSQSSHNGVHNGLDEGNDFPISVVHESEGEGEENLSGKQRIGRSAKGKKCETGEKGDAKKGDPLHANPTPEESGNDGDHYQRIELLAFLKEAAKKGVAMEEVEESVSMEELQKLETPMKWFQEFVSEDSSIFSHLCENNRETGWKKKNNFQQDYFRTATMHLCYSAKHILANKNLLKALKELSLSRGAQERFSECVNQQISKDVSKEWSSEALRGDRDVAKVLDMVIDSTEAVVRFRCERRRDSACILKTLRKQQLTQGVRAAINGIKAFTIAFMGSQLLVAVDIIQEAVTMAPNYWRWHYLLAVLLWNLPEPESPTRARERRQEILEALETVCHLEPQNTEQTLSLADAYCEIAFQVRRRRDVDENFKEYARKAVLAYTRAVEKDPQCVHTYIRAVRSLWNLRHLCPEVSRRVNPLLERATRVLMDVDGNELWTGNGGGDVELEAQAVKALALAFAWELIGNSERAVSLFRIAATNPLAMPNIVYRAEVGIIVSNFHKGKHNKGKTGSNPKVDILSQLDKLIVKFPDSDLQQQTLCLKGYYLMTIVQDKSAALEMFYKAVIIKPDNPFLKAFYPRFGLNYSRSINIFDQIHELACKELALVQVKASKGFPEAVMRAEQLNEQIQLAQKINRGRNKEAYIKGGKKSDDNSNESSDISPGVQLCQTAIKDHEQVERKGDGPQAKSKVECLPDKEHTEKVGGKDPDYSPVRKQTEEVDSNDPDYYSSDRKQTEQVGGKDPDISFGEAVLPAKPVEEGSGDKGNTSVEDHLNLIFKETSV